MYRQCLPVLHANSLGYGDVLGCAGLDAPLGTVSHQDAFSCLHLTAIGLASAAAITRYATSDDQHRRRSRIVNDWATWAASYPLGVRPALASCQPAGVVCFLDHWRDRHAGKRRRVDSGDGTPDRCGRAYIMCHLPSSVRCVYCAWALPTLMSVCSSWEFRQACLHQQLPPGLQSVLLSGALVLCKWGRSAAIRQVLQSTRAPPWPSALMR